LIPPESNEKEVKVVEEKEELVAGRRVRKVGEKS
jgi:hypothetical protein